MNSIFTSAWASHHGDRWVETRDFLAAMANPKTGSRGGKGLANLPGRKISTGTPRGRFRALEIPFPSIHQPFLFMPVFKNFNLKFFNRTSLITTSDLLPEVSKFE